MVRSLAIKAAILLGGVYLVRRLTKRPTRREHANNVANLLCGEKFSTEQAARDPLTFFNLRLDTCPATTQADGTKVLYCEQAFWRSPEKPFRQRFYAVRPCPKDMKCEVEVATYGVRDAAEYRNFCSKASNQRPQPEEIEADISEHLTTVFLTKCDRGKKCLYEGSTPPGGYPSSWNGATRCASELTLFKSGELHCWDRGYNDDGLQVWGPKPGPYEYKPKSHLSAAARETQWKH